MAWPQSTDFLAAVQDLAASMDDEELQGGEVVCTPLGLPMLWAGNFADVFKVHCPATGNTWALKCFTRPVQGLHDRYRHIAAHLERANLPFTVDFQYLERGIRIGDEWFPVLKMRWVEGLTLSQFVEKHLEQPGNLKMLLDLWERLAARLQGAQVTHADLQHGNVLLVPTGGGAFALRLVDYDGIFVPALAGMRSGEVGHPAYQHPQRLREGLFNAEVDRFSHLAIYTAIRCLMSGRTQLWERFNNGDNLLFREEDFCNPGESKLFRLLWKNLPDADARSLVGRLILACKSPLDETPLPDEILRDGKPISLNSEQESAVNAIFSPLPKSPAKSDSTERLLFDELPPSTSDSRSEQPPALPSRPTKKAATIRNVFQAAAAPLRVLDRMLLAMAGPENSLLHNFFRVLVMVVVFGSLFAGIMFRNHLRSIRERELAVVRQAEKEAADIIAENEAKQRESEQARKKAEDDAARRKAEQARLNVEQEAKKRQKEEATTHKKRPLLGKPIHVFQGHTFQAISVSFSQNGNRLLTRSSGDTILWNVDSSQPVRIFDRHINGGYLTTFSVFSPDSRWGLSGYQRGRKESSDLAWTASVWDANTGEQIRTWERPGSAIGAIAVSPDGKRLFLGMSSEQCRQMAAVICDAETGKQQCVLKGRRNAVHFAEFNQDGKQVLTTSNGYEAVLWDADAGEQIRVFGLDRVTTYSGAFSPNGKTVLTGTNNQGILWDVYTGQRLRTFDRHIHAVLSVAFSPDGKRVLTGSHDKTAILWDADTGEQLCVFKGYCDAIHSVAFDPNGNRILTGSSDGSVILWNADLSERIEDEAKKAVEQRATTEHNDATAWQPLHVLELPQGFLAESFAVSPDGKRCLVGTTSLQTVLWDMETGKQQHVFLCDSRIPGVLSVAFSSDGQKIFTAHASGQIIHWDAASGGKIKTFNNVPSERIAAAALSPDGRQAICVPLTKQPGHSAAWNWGESAILMDVETGKTVHTLHSNGGSVRKVAFSRDARQAITSGYPELWDTSTGDKIRTFGKDDPQSVALSPSKKQIICGFRDGRAEVWDTATGEHICTLRGHDEDAVASVAISDDNLAITGGRNRAILWNVKSGEQIHVFKDADVGASSGSLGNVVFVAFVGKNNDRILTGCTNGTMIIWNAGLSGSKNLANLAQPVGPGGRRLQLDGNSAYDNSVKCVAFSLDGQTAFTATAGGQVASWNVMTGEKIRMIHDPPRPGMADVSAATFSPDRRSLLLVPYEQQNSAVSSARTAGLAAILWDMDTGKIIRSFNPQNGSVHSVAFSPNCHDVLTVSQKPALWSIASGEILHTFDVRGGLDALAFSQDGRQLAGFTGAGGMVVIYNAETGEQIGRLNTEKGKGTYFNCLAFSPDGKQILTGFLSNNGPAGPAAALWEVATGKKLRTFDQPGVATAVAFSPDGRQVFVASCGPRAGVTIRLWDASLAEPICALEGHNTRVESVAFSRDGRRLLTGAMDGAVLWDLSSLRLGPSVSGNRTSVNDDAAVAATRRSQPEETAKGVQQIRIFPGRKNGTVAAFSPDGGMALVANWPFSASLWDMNTGKSHILDEPDASVCEFGPDGKMAIIGSSVWDVATRERISVFKSFGRGLAMSLDRIAVADGAFVFLLDANTAKQIHKMKGYNNGRVTSAVFAPDGKQLLAGYDKKVAILWDVATGQAGRTFQGHTDSVTAVAFGQRGDRILTGGRDLVAILWDAHSGKQIRVFRGHSRKTRYSAIASVAISPDGKWLLTGSDDRTAILWDATTGNKIHVFDGYVEKDKTFVPFQNQVVHVAFIGNDGDQVIVGCSNGAAVWDISAIAARSGVETSAKDGRDNSDR